jgi:glucosamine--fructose-6-phosphate aminotransferase (isomerizing)
MRKLADHTIFVPQASELTSPILEIVPLQLFAYYMAVRKGLDVDRPRHLVKSVTVE